MVDTDLVMERLKKGLYVGAGSFAAGFVGSSLTSNQGLLGLGLSSRNASLGKIAIGVGVSTGAERISGGRTSDTVDIEELVEFAGYGMTGDGFSELGETIETGAAGGRRVVNMDRAQTAELEVRRDNTNTTGSQDFLVDA